MKAHVLTSRHSDIRPGMDGKILCRKFHGYVVEFRDVTSYGGFTKPILTVWMEENEVDLIEDGEPIPQFEPRQLEPVS